MGSTGQSSPFPLEDWTISDPLPTASWALSPARLGQGETSLEAELPDVCRRAFQNSR